VLTELTGILLSIKPKYVNAILEGTKKIEFRKQIFRDRSRDTIFIYSSSPTKKIVGYFRLGEIVEGHPDYLWEQFWNVSGIEEETFFEYFAGRENGYAIRIDELEQFGKPIDPHEIFDRFVPPQSFCYVDSYQNQTMTQYR
jgi:predicted transcriptional regulator